MRHALGLLGVLAAAVMLAVSAAMNWRFGFQLGKTEFDGQIYGAASAAADCLKALLPFFLFAAVRNRMWSQAAASAVLWVVVTAYSLTSAVGLAALNRADTTGERALQAATYKDQRTEIARLHEQLTWIPQHRPAATVDADIKAMQNDRPWKWTEGCTKVTGPQGRKFCDGYHKLVAEHASAGERERLSSRLAELKGKTSMAGGTVMSEADPQAVVLTKLGTNLFPNLKVEDVQTAMALFVALLLEVGSSFGLYVAFSQWRIYDRVAAAPPVVEESKEIAIPIAAEQPQQVANDNRSEDVREVPPKQLMAPQSDVERFYQERVTPVDGSSMTAMELYEDYCDWCERQEKEPLALPTFGREFGELGVQKAKIAGRIRYIGIRVGDARERSGEAKKLAATQAVAA